MLLSIATVFALLLILLAIPIAIAFDIERSNLIGGRASGHIRFRWLFGLVRFRVELPVEEKEEKKPKKKKKKKAKAGGARGFLTVVKNSAFRKRTIRFFKDVLRATHANDLVLRLRIGTGDPADTGQLWALMGPIAGLVDNIRFAEFRIEPEWMDPVFAIESRGQFRFIPLQLFGLATAFAVSPATIRAWSAAHRSRK